MTVEVVPMGALDRTWQLYKQSFTVLSADIEILLFPVMSAVAAILVAAGFFIPLYQIGSLAAIHNRTARWDDWACLFAWYCANFFVIIFFNSALVACANIRLSGGDPTVRDGLRIAFMRIHRITAWTLVAATVGVVLQSLRNRRNILGGLLGSALGLGWTLITYLIVPVLIFEDRGILDSIYYSADLFRKHWGEQVAGSFGFGLLNLVLFIPGFLLGALIWAYDPVAGLIVGFVYLLILATLSSAVKGVFTVALYRYATAGEVPPGFSASLIDGALRGRRLME
jgi:hypothetical protein